MGKFTDKIIHINASPEFLANPKCMKALEKLCKLAYNQNISKQKKSPQINAGIPFDMKN